MRFSSAIQSTVALLAAVAAPLAAQGPAAVAEGSAQPAPAVFQLLRAQAELVQEAESTYRAREIATLPGWADAVRDAERRTRLTWLGMPPVILLVPDGGRGFACDDKQVTCLGRYQGVTLQLRQGSDSGRTTISNVILIAESARTRPDVWIHELTHALLSQHGLVAASQRHDPRYFAEEHFVRMEF